MMPDIATLLDTIAARVELGGPRRYVAAFSGGLDSTVLLDLARRALPQVRGASLLAVHVNHRLHDSAADCARHCALTARRFGVRLETIEVEAQAGAGQSPEAAARRARYDALRERLGDGDVVLTAHTLDDQFETVVLQLMRGAGVAGLAGMPVNTEFEPGWLLRPLLASARADVAAYAQRHGLEWFTDPTNTDQRFDRNYLRHTVLPGLTARWPAAAVAAARSARHCASARAVLDEVAAADLVAAGDEQHRLALQSLLQLSAPRRANLMRYWIARQGLPGPGSAHLERCLSDLTSPRNDTEACVSWPGAQVRRFRDRLYALCPLPAGAPDFNGSLGPGGQCALPDGLGVLRVSAANGEGLALARCAGGLAVRFRAGGERIRPHDQARTRRLRTLFQEAGIVPWMRSRVPLLYAGDRLAAVGDLWVAHEFAASAGEAGLRVVWQGHPLLY